MSRFIFFASLLLAFTCSCIAHAAEVKQTENNLDIVSSCCRVSVNLANGTINFRNSVNDTVLGNAYGLWSLSAQGGKNRSVPTAGSGTRKVSVAEKNAGGETVATITFTPDKSPFSLETELSFPEDKPYFTIKQSITAKEDGWRIENAQVLGVTAERGGEFWGGRDPSSIWVLENGYKKFYDFFVRLVRADEAVNSNWNATYYYSSKDETFLAGFVTAEHGYVSIRSFYDEKTQAGKGGLSSLKASVEYEPSPPLRAGKKYDSETLLIGNTVNSLPHELLEAFADAVALHSGGEGFSERLKKLEIPTGWNSWSTTYHHGITEENILENAKRAKTLFLPFGMKTFQVDDGYQQALGDWEANEKFPGRMKKTADNIKALGFIPGIWSTPFCVSAGSSVAREHPDWIAPKNQLGETLMPKDWLILDPTNPGAQQWLRETYSRYSREWGFKTLKIDFIYYALLAKKYYDPDATSIDAYRTGLRIVREAAGDDATIVSVGVPIANSAGLVDGMRLGLDITPKWQDETTINAQGVKPMVRNLSRRYYLNGRVWYNHPDSFYLGSPEEKKRWGDVITTDEAIAYGTLASINGAILKIGDSFVGLTDEQADIYRRLIPAYRATARPLDLFWTYYPVVWTLPVSRGGEEYTILALFNWGANEVTSNEQEGNPWKKTPDQAEEFKIDTLMLALIGLDYKPDYIVTESWGGTFEGIISDEPLKTILQPHTTKVFAIRKLLDRPQFIYTNRHITQGGTDIDEIVWNPDTNTLTGRQETVAGFDYKLMFHAPAGYIPTTAEACGKQAELSLAAPVATMKFKGPENECREWSVKFSRI